MKVELTRDRVLTSIVLLVLRLTLIGERKGDIRHKDGSAGYVDRCGSIVSTLCMIKKEGGRGGGGGGGGGRIASKSLHKEQKG